MGWRQAILLGAIFQLAQLVLCLFRSGHSRVGDAWRGLASWDGKWYQHIVEHGYVSSVPPVAARMDQANVAFFPGYPIAAKLVQHLSGLDAEAGCLVAAQLAALAFWVLFFRALQTQNTSLGWQLGFGVILFTHPAAFFLQAAYSESLFSAVLFALLLLSRSNTTSYRGQAATLGAGAAGMMLAATRIVGAPLALIPAMVAILDRLSSKKGVSLSSGRGVSLLSGKGGSCGTYAGVPGQRPHGTAIAQSAFVAAMGLFGIGLFFFYCHWQWGDWNLYFDTQRIGWGVKPDYFAVFRGSLWNPVGLPQSAVWPHQANNVSVIMVPVYLWLALGVSITELVRSRMQKDGAWRTRLPWILAAGIMLFVNISALGSAGYRSFSRYALPVQACLLVAASGWLPRNDKAQGDGNSDTIGLWRRRIAWGLMLAALAAMVIYQLAVQLRFIEHFTHGRWVATR